MNTVKQAMQAVDQPSKLERLAADYNHVKADLVKARDRRNEALQAIAKWQEVVDVADTHIAGFEAKLAHFAKQIQAQMKAVDL